MRKSESLLEVERLEKEGKIKEMIPKWEKEHKKLRGEWQKLYEQEKKEVFSQPLWKKVENGEIKYEDLEKVIGGKELKAKLEKLRKEMQDVSKPEAELGSRLEWSRMTPEQRERKLAESEASKKSTEAWEKERDGIKSKLTKKELEIYDLIWKFFFKCSGRPCIYAATMDQAGKQISERQEGASKIMDAAISKAGDNNVETFKKNLTKKNNPNFFI